jgi:hypothetical protein
MVKSHHHSIDLSPSTALSTVASARQDRKMTTQTMLDADRTLDRWDGQDVPGRVRF